MLIGWGLWVRFEMVWEGKYMAKVGPVMSALVLSVLCVRERMAIVVFNVAGVGDGGGLLLHRGTRGKSDFLVSAFWGR